MKIKDKNECEKIKESINNELNKTLYYSEKNEVKINNEFKNDLWHYQNGSSFQLQYDNY